MLTKKNLIETYLQNIPNKDQWPTGNLERFSEAVEVSIMQGRTLFNKDSDVLNRTWKSLGGKGKPTWKAMFSLPEN